MSRPLRLNKGFLLPQKAERLAEIINSNGGSITRNNLEIKVRKSPYLKRRKIDKHVRLLRMTENLEIRSGEAHLVVDDSWDEGKTSVMKKFRRWERKAKKENESNLAKINSK